MMEAGPVLEYVGRGLLLSFALLVSVGVWRDANELGGDPHVLDVFGRILLAGFAWNAWISWV